MLHLPVLARCHALAYSIKVKPVMHYCTLVDVDMLYLPTHEWSPVSICICISFNTSYRLMKSQLRTIVTSAAWISRLQSLWKLLSYLSPTRKDSRAWESGLPRGCCFTVLQEQVGYPCSKLLWHVHRYRATAHLLAMVYCDKAINLLLCHFPYLKNILLPMCHAAACAVS